MNETTGQVGAIRLGISRALQNWEPGLRPPLKEGTNRESKLFHFLLVLLFALVIFRASTTHTMVSTSSRNVCASLWFA